MLRQLKEILVEVKEGMADASSLPDDLDVIGDVGLDSLEMLEFMLEVETRLNIELDFEQLDFDSLRNLSVFAEQLESFRPRL